jgi:adenosine deaminase
LRAVERAQALRDLNHLRLMRTQTSALLRFLVAIALCSTLSLSGWQAKPVPASSAVQRAFDRVRNNPLELRAFLERMPKGADLHLHASGAVYAESYIQEAADDNLCVELAGLTVIPNAGTTRSLPPKPVCPERSVAVSSAFTDQKLYDSLINAFSMRSFVPFAGRSGHDQFFATFDRFLNIDPQKHLGQWLDEISRRAAAQNEQYVEVMHTPDFAAIAKLGYEVGWNGNPAETRTALLSKVLRENVQKDQAELDRAESERRRLQGCADVSKEGPCGVKIRYLFQVLRGFPPQQVFAQTLLGFELASVDPRVVGINFVMAEDWYMPMHEYHVQMEMLDYLHSVYPKVHISLHAGELAPGVVPPDGLKSHIREAVELGHAERIGHGVDVMYERNPHQLMAEMASKGVAVEINITSNDVILGVKGREHPLPLYRSAGVPVVLCTDDEGVSRIDLTHEYARAVSEFNLTYLDLKKMARTSLERSFLPPDEKAREVSELERRFRAFESQAQ